MPSIANQSLLVIGGSSGIGYGVAKLALAQGLRVSISSSNPSRISKAVDSLRKEFPNGSINGFPCDLKSDQVESNLEKLFTQVIAANNNGELLDHIVFTAGDPLATKPLSEIDIDFIRGAGQVRFVAPLLVGKLVPRFVKQSFKSSFTLTSGTIVRRPAPNWSVVAGYAAGAEKITRNLGLDLKPVRVNSVMAGAVDTELWGTGDERNAMIEMLKNASFQGRVPSAEEVAEAYIYFMRDTNVNGTTLNTDGGQFLR